MGTQSLCVAGLVAVSVLACGGGDSDAVDASVDASAPRPVSFAPHIRYPVAPNALPGSLRIARLDTDPYVDLAVRNNTGASLSTFRSQGDGTFAPAVDIATPEFPQDLVAGDLNGDARVDLATEQAVHLNNGDGTFASGQLFGVGAAELALADLDHDTKLDLVASRNVEALVYVLRGTGNGTFAQPVGYATGEGPGFVATGDLDRDGNLDLVVVLRGAQQAGRAVSVLRGTATGPFTPHRDFDVGLVRPQSVTIVDLDGDGNLDLAVSCSGEKNISVLLGNGDGTFGSPIVYATGSANAVFTTIASEDLNGDASPDLVITLAWESSVGVYLNRGDGTFLTPPTMFPVDSMPHDVGIADLDGDTWPDLAVTTSVGVSVLRQIP